MEVIVYFETNAIPMQRSAEQVAILSSEEMYALCLPALEAEAAKHNMIVTESVEED
jgi:hypothetical protein